jgi:AraC-like DNA-binding protein
LVKQRTGYSPMQDFNKLRINRAKLLLRATR